MLFLSKVQSLMNRYHFDFRLYQRHFRQPLKTSHGDWKIREGIIIQLTDEVGKIGWGEIAPLPWFGSETLAQAKLLCQQLNNQVTLEEIRSIPDSLPACKFAFESALEFIEIEFIETKKINFAHLLPAGEAALKTWHQVLKQDIKTFKWKIGVYPIATEIAIYKQLLQELPDTAKLRLDANGGLTLEAAEKWLQEVDNLGKVEFIEQPLPPSQFSEMQQLAAKFTTPLALDESVANFNQLIACQQRGWQGIYVIKPGIMGSPQRLRQFFQKYSIDAVFSSVLETSIGRKAALNLARELSSPHRAVGFGVNHWFTEDEESWLASLWKTP